METFTLITVKNSNLKSLQGSKFSKEITKAKPDDYGMFYAIRYQELGYNLDQIQMIKMAFNEGILIMHGIVEDGRFVHINYNGSIAYFDFI